MQNNKQNLYHPVCPSKKAGNAAFTHSISAVEALLASRKKCEINRSYKQGERHEMIPVETFAFEQERCHNREHDKSQRLLDNLELNERERTAVALESYAVGRNHKRVFHKRNEPGKQNHTDKRPVFGDSGRLQLQVAIPRKSHKHV